jgi:hypothetical protein
LAAIENRAWEKWESCESCEQWGYRWRPGTWKLIFSGSRSAARVTCSITKSILFDFDSSAKSVGELNPWALAFMPEPAAFFGQG